jgi:23S rRNA-intervening sequence protein
MSWIRYRKPCRKPKSFDEPKPIRSHALLVLRRYACLAKWNGIGGASLHLNGNTSEKRGLRLDLTNPAVNAIRYGQYCRRLWPKTHQGQAQLLNFYYMSRGSLAETKSHLIYGFRVGYFQESELSGLLELIAKYLGRIEQVNQTCLRGIRLRLRFRLRF